MSERARDARASYDTVRLRVHIDDEERLASLQEYGILDTAPEPRYEKLAEVLRAACDAAWSTITFVDRDRQWFKARSGCDASETARSVSFCSVSMLQDEPLIVQDARLDARFRESATVTGEPFVRFYAGYPIFSREGYGLGSVCVNDTRPRVLLPEQLKLLAAGRDWVQADLEVRRIGRAPWKEQQRQRTVKKVSGDLILEYAVQRSTSFWTRVEEAAAGCRARI